MVYLLLGFLLVLRLARSSARQPDLIEQMILGLSVALAGSAAWFVLLQIAVVRQACIYCNLIHLIALAIFAIVMTSAVQRRSPFGTQGVLTWGGNAVLAALGGVVVLLGGHLLWRPKTYAILPTDRTI